MNIHNFALKFGKKLSRYSSDNLKESYTFDELEQMITYFIEITIKDILWIAPLIIISIKLNIVFVTLAIMITFMPLRLTLGGFHFQSDFLCIITTITFPIILSYIALNVDFNFTAIIIIYIFAIITIFVKGVVDNPKKQFKAENRRLNLKLKSIFYIIGKIFTALICIVHIYIFFRGYKFTSNAISLGVIAAYSNLYFGK